MMISLRVGNTQGAFFDRLALSFVHARLDTNDYFIFPHVARASRYTTG